MRSVNRSNMGFENCIKFSRDDLRKGAASRTQFNKPNEGNDNPFEAIGGLRGEVNGISKAWGKLQDRNTATRARQSRSTKCAAGTRSRTSSATRTGPSNTTFPSSEILCERGR